MTDRRKPDDAAKVSECMPQTRLRYGGGGELTVQAAPAGMLAALLRLGWATRVRDRLGLRYVVTNAGHDGLVSLRRRGTH